MRPVASAPMTIWSPHPAVAARMIPHTMHSIDTIARVSASGSTGRRVPRLSATRHITAPAAASPTGTLIQKIHRHERAWVSVPPRTGPSTVPRPVTEP